MITIDGPTVRFGGVTPLDTVSLQFPLGTCGLIGPNGAGKTTFFNVLSGFVHPVTGQISAFGTDLLSMPSYKRARWGIRRTFQTEQTIDELTVFDNIALVHEHSGTSRGSLRRDVLEALEFVGLGASPGEQVMTLRAGDRRILEVARAVVGSPRLVLLDEPAAGLPEKGTQHLADVIRNIPERYGALVILVDHDMSLVSACCERTAVLDFGRLIASGATADGLCDEHVRKAYLGSEEEI